MLERLIAKVWRFQTSGMWLCDVVHMTCLLVHYIQLFGSVHTSWGGGSTGTGKKEVHHFYFVVSVYCTK